MKSLMFRLLNPKFITIIHNDGSRELGIKIWGVTFVLYKGEALMVNDVKNSRPVEKREFGESLCNVH